MTTEHSHPWDDFPELAISVEDRQAIPIVGQAELACVVKLF